MADENRLVDVDVIADYLGGRFQPSSSRRVVALGAKVRTPAGRRRTMVLLRLSERRDVAAGIYFGIFLRRILKNF